MTTSIILPLADRQANLETVGGKGMSLARLARVGLPVPGGFQITTQAYCSFVAENRLQDRILAALADVDPLIPASLEAASREISDLFSHAETPPELGQAIEQAYLALADHSAAVAVRSSATAEDLPEASFAGQQETYLNVHGTQALLRAVKNCWASLWTARAIGYRARRNISPQGVALAVVVQIMVRAEAAGILFTANPINGRRDEMLINAAWGLGEAVVSGAVTPDSIIVRKADGSVLRRETARKRVMTVRTVEGTEEQAVPESLQAADVLSDRQVAELARYGARIESLYGLPMDIEWALAEGEFAILQARPVTALPEVPIEWAPPDPRGTYMRASVVDLLPDPLSPLFITLGIPALRTQMKPLGRRLLGADPVLADDYFTVINSYAYMNARMPPRSWWWILTSLLPAYPSLLRKLVPIWREELRPAYRAFVAEKQDQMPAELSANALWRGAQEMVDAAMYYVCGLMFATMGASAGSEGLLTQVYNRLVRQEGDPDANVMLMGWDTIPVQAEKSLFDLASWCRARQALAAYLEATPAPAIWNALRESRAPPAVAAGDWQELQRRFDRHLRQFGYLVFQLDFAAPLPLDDPAPMLENLKMHLRQAATSPYARQQASEAMRMQTAETMLSRLRGFKRWAFRIALNWGQSMAEVREDALAEIGLGYPLLRALLRELGGRLAAAGAIAEAEDIFWLEKAEIDACVARLDRGALLDSLAEEIKARQALWQRLKEEIPPSMMPIKKRIMGIRSDVYVAHHDHEQTGDLLKGVATSAGRVTAPARVIAGPHDFDQMRPGDVLVAGTTTPAWTPLFAMASGVVTDIGGPLSHGSIVAREYGIPAVMGTGVATRRIRSGQAITVDGGQGVVYLAEPAQAAAVVEWKPPDRKSVYARGSLAEHTPTPVSPLFATLGLEIANQETMSLWEGIIGEHAHELIVGGFYQTINSYVYGGFRLGLRQLPAMLRVMGTQIGPMFRGTVARWRQGRQRFAEVVAEWESKPVESLPAIELLEGVRIVFGAAARYYTVIQTTLPAASSSEVLFTRFYRALVKRRNDPPATTLLFGFETTPVRTEKSLYDIAVWLKDRPVLAEYLLHTPNQELIADLRRPSPPGAIEAGDWQTWRLRIGEHFEDFGRTAYEFDFANPTPAEAPEPQLEAIKLFLQEKTASPYQRLQTAVENRERATGAILDRLGWPRKNWFLRLLQWAQQTGAIREDSIADMGLGHPIIRRMLNELGRRLAAAGAITQAGDIYWLEQSELGELVAALDRGPVPADYAAFVPARKEKWRAALHLEPPVLLPERSWWNKLIGGGEARSKNGRVILKGVGTSPGKVTAPACVLHSPQDFHKMKPGDVLVATTTTPAWTPLFTMASAVVTDIGGPLSHSSIVAREYGIPAVMAARAATHRIRSGQLVTVDGSAGTVELEA